MYQISNRASIVIVAILALGSFVAGQQSASSCDDLDGRAAGLCRAATTIGCAATSTDAACLRLSEAFQDATGTAPPWLELWVTTFDEFMAALQDAQVNPDVVVHLINDIDASTSDGTRRSGSAAEYLRGTIDGHGHALTGWTSDHPLIDVSLGGRVRNLRFTGDVDTSNGWNGRVGLLHAYMERGFVENVQVTGAVIYRGTTGDYTGGVVGDVGYSLIWRTSFTGAITSSSKNVGGIAGGIYPGGDMILDCHARGDIAGLDSVGGILGVASQGGGIRNVWFRGNVTGRTYVGGVVGLLYGTVANSYAGGTVTGALLWGRIAGGMTDAGIVDNSYGEGLYGTIRGVGPYTYGDGYGALVNGSALVPTLANIYSAAVAQWDDAVWAKDPQQLADPLLIP